ncbi:Spermatogenesis-associated protein 1 [Triplophysa tibetana]|uniref:Spermatogenesis-associated protein 1 n=1 Tax=Triplophysa tibetana TaxID=1572043 RepID=A0A5A9NHP3_9TELE|nr:Spermatogenesis-associated protein 1 [Triplophysa tibetana]
MSDFTGRRNKTTQGLELHVFYVPEDQFDRRLNKVSADAVNAFISAGFIRVDSDMTLSDLRAELGCFLGLDRITEKYVFLKCVGRSLALAPFPELYLLPVGEHDSGLCSISLTPDTLVSSADHHSQDLRRPTCAPGQSKEHIKFPSINKRAQQSLLMRAEEKNGSDEDTQSTDTHHLTYSSQDHKEPEAKQSERHIAKQDVYSEVKMDTVTKTKHSFKRTSSGDPGLLVDADQSPILVRKFNTSMTLKSSGEKSDHVVPVSRPNSPLPTVCSAQLSLFSLELYTQQTTTSRDKWKRKYFDTKKATVQHENTLRTVRQELHTFYCKMLRQLQARESTRHQTQAGKLSSTKNDLIIQIMTESCEIDNLRKNVDDAKMKLATEIKLRNQASTELQTLRAELMQKRSQM